MYYTYILTNKSNSVLYIGMTNDLTRRIAEHKSGEIDGFSSKYNLNKLVYFEKTEDVNNAIKREKQLKGWSRAKKIALVETLNPAWNDLSED